MRGHQLRKTITLIAAFALIGGLVSAMPASARRHRRQVVRGQNTDAPRSVLGMREDARKLPAPRAARAHLRRNVGRYEISDPGRDLVVEEVIRSDDRTTVRFSQQYKGTPVFGAQYLVHMRRSSEGLATESVNGNFFTDLDVDVEPRFSEASARRLAVRRVRNVVADGVESHGLSVLPTGGGTPAYHFTLRGVTIGRVPVRQEVFVNAHTGAIAFTYNNIKFDGPVVGTGIDADGDSVTLNLYRRGTTIEARDQSRAMFADGGEITTHDALGEDFVTFVPTDANIATDTDTTFDGLNTTSGAVDAHWGAGQVYEYFLALGRNSIDGDGMSIVSVVNAGDFQGAPLYNALWDGAKMIYGNPNPTQLYPLSADLDIVAHELTHGVTEFSGDLVYLGQSGAMNEAYSDYFGNAVDVDVSGTAMDTPGAGFIGEDICKVALPDAWDCPLRDLNDGRTTDDYIYYLVDIDNGGVHLNSTIYGGALWNLREQLSSDKADMLVYTALTEYTTPLDGFTDGRISILTAAEALGFSASEKNVVAGVFDAAGIVAGWDEVGGSDSDVLIENFAPLGSFFSPPRASGSRYVVAHYQDPLAACCEPAQIVVGNINGTGGLTDVGQSRSATTVNDELPDLSGDLAVWSHVTEKSGGLDFEVNGRRLGGGLKRIASARGFQWFPSVDGNLVAWEDTRRGDTNIFARRLGNKPVRVTNKFGEEYEPDVSGNWIAWWDVPDFGERAAIGLMNFKTGKKVRIDRPGRAFVGAPAIAGKYVYWYEDSDFFTRRSGAGFGTIMRARRNGKEIKPLFKETHRLAPVWNGYTSPPKVSANNNWVAYHEEFGYSHPSLPAAEVGRDVFMVSAKGGPPLFVSCNKGDQAFPAIGWGQNVVFMDSSRLSTDLVTRSSPAGTC